MNLISFFLIDVSIVDETCVDETPFWVDYRENSIPRGALKGGRIGDEVIYIGRAMHNSALTPGSYQAPKATTSINSYLMSNWFLGSVVSSENTLYLAWGFEAHTKTDFEILVGGSSCNWVVSKSGYIPVNAFIAGFTEHGESLFIGRQKHGEKLLVGKIHPSYKTCYIPDIGGTKELEFSDYEVLVV